MRARAFLQTEGACFDVRSPAEFQHAHIPGAISLALFNDSERAEIGTLYKQVGKDEAIRRGVSIVGPKLSSILEKIQNTTHLGPKKIYCWRGGMRSGFVLAFLQSLGIDAIQLEGGYKAYRKKVLQAFEGSFPFYVLGGMTGCGKTELLHELERQHEHVLDLENAAQHRGSVFGEHLDQTQPSSEQFENILASKLCTTTSQTPIWIEDESRLIGEVILPAKLYYQMQDAPLFLLQCSFDERVARIMRTYAPFPKQWWCEKTKKIAKRLGSERAKTILEAIENNRLQDAVAQLLYYYDKAYAYALSKRKGQIFELCFDGVSFQERAQMLIHFALSCAHERAFDHTGAKTV